MSEGAARDPSPRESVPLWLHIAYAVIVIGRIVAASLGAFVNQTLMLCLQLIGLFGLSSVACWQLEKFDQIHPTVRLCTQIGIAAGCAYWAGRLLGLV